MKVIHVNSQVEGGQVTFPLLKDGMTRRTKALGLVTGSTPLSFYEEIRKSNLDLLDIISINLDECVGLVTDNEQSCRHFMQENFFQYKPFKESFLPNGLAEDLQAETHRYDQVVAEHGIGFQILRIGCNDHIGFNEPGTPLDMTTYTVDLAKDTIEANSRLFASMGNVPEQTISMGIKSIMAPKMVVLMTYGEGKADIISQMVNGPVTEELPVSVLRNHPNAVVTIDEAAASRLD